MKKLLSSALYSFSKATLWTLFRVGFSLSVRGQEHVPSTGPCILACNHVSFLDPPVLGATSPRRVDFMARSSLFENPLLGAYMRTLEQISLRRGELDISALREAVKRLRQGRVVALFPEGGRQRNGELGTAKRGVGLLAVTGRAPIVPVLIQGTYQAMSPERPMRLHPAKISVAFSEPIPYTTSPTLSTTPTASRDLHEQLAQKVTAAWQRLASDVRKGSP